MIVTFHLVCYFVHFIYVKYVSNSANNDNRAPNTEDDSDNTNANSGPTSTQVAQGNDVPRQNATNNRSNTQPENTVPNKKIKEEPKDEADEEKEILDHIDHQDKRDGCNAVYNIEPDFYSTFDERGILFVPPVYIQRYMSIDQILKQPCWIEKIRKVVDFGCAELSFEFRYLKKIVNVEEVVSVDIDEQLLSESHSKLNPTVTDYLAPRDKPLTFRVMSGSVGNTHPVLEGADAVIAIELIEHLFPPDLEQLPFTVFGFIRPKLAIFTTPNVDFNVLFPDPSKFRHDDHKFEWTRQQFEEWAKNLAERYPEYSVRFQGIGPGPEGTEHLGCCSQMAVFVKNDNQAQQQPTDSEAQNGPYNLVAEHVYPFDTRTEDDKIKDEAISFLNRIVSMRRFHTDNDENEEKRDDKRNEISLLTVMTRIRCTDRKKVRSILQDAQYEVKINSDGKEVVVLPDDEEESEESLYSDHGEQDYQLQEVSNSNHSEEDEDWDCDPKNESQQMVNKNLNCSAISGHPKSAEDFETEDNFFDPNADKDSSSWDVTISNNENTISTPVNETSGYNLESNTFNIFSLNGEELSVYETPSIDVKHWNRNSSNPQVQPTFNSMCDTNNFDSYPENSPVDNNYSVDSWDCDTDFGDTSIYFTPCNIQNPRKNTQKSLYFQQIDYSPLTIETSTNDSNKAKRSLNILESENVQNSKIKNSEVLGNDSFNEKDIDSSSNMDQWDEKTFVCADESKFHTPLNQPFKLPNVEVNDVRNKNVSNENRNGEVNNTFADMDEDSFEYDAQIQVVDETQHLEGGIANMDIDEIDFDGKIVSDDCNPQHLHSELPEQIPIGEVWATDNISISSIETTYPVNFASDAQRDLCRNNLKTHNSLTTVLDGCSKFSKCSLVSSSAPKNEDEVSNTISSSKETPHSSYELDNGSLENFNKDSDPLDNAQKDDLSLKSWYLSTESLVSDHSETSSQPFPKWLLEMSVEDDVSVRISEVSVWDINSVSEQSIQIPIDARGGGDPQGDIWF